MFSPGCARTWEGTGEVGQDEGAAASRGCIVTKIALRNRFHCVHLPIHPDTPRKLLEMKYGFVHTINHTVSQPRPRSVGGGGRGSSDVTVQGLCYCTVWVFPLPCLEVACCVNSQEGDPARMGMSGTAGERSQRPNKEIKDL